jgi:hypothetical protein
MIEGRTGFYRVILSLAAFFLAVKGIDIALGHQAALNPPSPGTVMPGILTFDLFPYEGWHLPANFLHRGALPRESQPYSDYTIQTGSMGFFVDFDLNNPPPKARDEFRIILTGGSGAQGWGAQTNELMLYRQLEKQLNSRLKGARLHVRVINLAMAGTVAYQNFITLNRYAHPLKPDLILSYIGYNEFEQLFKTRNDGYFQFTELNALVLASRGSEFGRGPGFLQAALPNLMTKTNFGAALNWYLGGKRFIKGARSSYEASRGVRYGAMSNQDFIKATAIDQSVLALQSIKRDFEGIPIVLAWQTGGEWVQDFARRNDLPDDFYDRAFEAIERELVHSTNDQWTFINVHKMFEGGHKPYIGVHLGNEGHQIVAGILGERILSYIKKDRRMAASK